MRPWYRNSTLQMDDAEMEWLQSKDAASCAVWEWLKADSQKRGDGSVRELSEQEKDTISRRLGIDSPRFSQISQNLHKVGWVSQSGIKGWRKWQGSRTPEEDAARKQAEYWKLKANELQKKEIVSPKTSHCLPDSPLEQRRTEESIIKPEPPAAVKSDLSVFTELWVEEYPKHHGGTKYLHGGAKDAQAAKRMLVILNPVELIAVARKAWLKPDDFNCKQAASISGMASRINEIQAAVSAAKKTVKLWGNDKPHNGKVW